MILFCRRAYFRLKKLSPKHLVRTTQPTSLRSLPRRRRKDFRRRCSSLLSFWCFLRSRMASPKQLFLCSFSLLLLFVSLPLLESRELVCDQTDLTDASYNPIQDQYNDADYVLKVSFFLSSLSLLLQFASLHKTNAIIAYFPERKPYSKLR